MKAAMILILSIMLGLTMSTVRAAESHDHGQTTAGAKTEKLPSLGGGKTCDKCKKNKGGGMSGCCCVGMKEKMGMMSGNDQGGMDHDALSERMQNMEARMNMMQKMMEQMGKMQGTTVK